MSNLFHEEAEFLFTIKGYIHADFNYSDMEVITQIYRLLSKLPMIGTHEGLNIDDVKVKRLLK